MNGADEEKRSPLIGGFHRLYSKWKNGDRSMESKHLDIAKEFIISRKNPQDYEIDNLGRVHCKGDVVITEEDVVNGKFPVIFGKVEGDFDCSWCKSLESLEGAPVNVEGNFVCSHCLSLTSLEGCPETVGGDFDCSWCISLKSLVGSPKKVEGNFVCSSCPSLASLKGCPETVGGDFDCRRCTELGDIASPPSNIHGRVYIVDK